MLVDQVSAGGSAAAASRFPVFKRPNAREPEELIKPRFWTGKPAVPREHYCIDCGGQAPPIDAALKARMREVFERAGAVVLVNTGMTELSQMRPYMYDTGLMQNPMEYKGGSNHRGQLEPYFFEAGAPDSAWLHFHHEMAYVSKSTTMLGFACKRALPGVGEDGAKRGSTFLSDSVAVTNDLMKTELGRKLKERGLCYHRFLNDRVAYDGDTTHVFNFWQKSFGTDDPAEAERLAKERGLQVEWGVDPLGHPRYMMTKFRVSAFEYFPQMDCNLLYASQGDDNQWFDSWPGIKEMMPHHRPLQLTFGDGEPLSPEEWRLMVDLYDRHGFPVEWEVGDVAIVCNYRMAHGRPGFVRDEAKGEERVLGVVLGEVFDRVCDEPSKPYGTDEKRG